MTKQNQKSGDNSTNIQAHQIVVHQGMSLAEVRQVALDVFRSNFYHLAGKAHETAQARAEDITEQFLHKLEGENRAGFDKASDPDFQHALFTVQKEYARTGDRDLGELLIDLLVDRSKQEQRDILQIVLNESLNTAPKLTNSQLSALAVVFFFRYTQNLGIGTIELLGKHLDKYVQPFADSLPTGDSTYRHLEFCGCGSSDIRQVSLEALIGSIYQGLFISGFDGAEIVTRAISIGRDDRFFIPCLADSSKMQVRAVNKEHLEKNLDKYGITSDDRAKITGLMDVSKMSEADIKAKVIALRAYMEKVFGVWNTSDMRSFNLTSVGMAIGHANIKRLAGEFSDLSIWIN
jgi:hypothetical protein